MPHREYRIYKILNQKKRDLITIDNKIHMPQNTWKINKIYLVLDIAPYDGIMFNFC